MSLLNDMLRDLSHQQSTVETPTTVNQAALDFNAQEQRELFYNSSAAKPFPRTLMPSVLVFILVLAMLVLWKLAFFTPAGVNLPAGESNTAGKVVELAHQVTAESKPISEPVASDSVVPELGERIAALESAITHLSVVVANTNVQSSSKLPDAEVSANNEIVSTTPEHDNESLAKTGQVVEMVSTENQAAEEPVSASIREPFLQETTEPSAEPQTASLAEAGEPRLSIAPNLKWKDQQQAQQANELAAQGQMDIAVEKLQNFIATTDQPRESVKTLLNILAMQENAVAMQVLVAQADYLSAIEQTFYTAKIATIQRQDEQAIQLLETHLGEAEQDENYRALLAGLYQRNGMHLEAATHYRRLLSVFGDKPAYWLGFALAQDALNQPQVALQAYQRVNQYADLQPQVLTYVQQRITALQD